MLNPPKNANTPGSLLLRGPFYFDPLNPDPKAITLDAVAASLDAEARWLNQTTRPISVAEHLIRCGRIAVANDGTLAQILACMLHDVGEAVLRDLPGPFKRYVFVEVSDGVMIPYSEIERRVCEAIVTALIVDENLRAEIIIELAGGFVHAVDKAAEAIEALKWLPGSGDWALRHDGRAPSVDVVEPGPRAWMVADVPEHCSWRSWFERVDESVELRRHSEQRYWTPMWSPDDRVAADRLLRRLIGL